MIRHSVRQDRRIGAAGLLAALAMLAAIDLQPAAGRAATAEAVLWSLKGTPQGSDPVGELVADPKHANVYYGITEKGGVGGNGTVFKLTHQHGGWSGTVLYSFTGGKDGWHPEGSLAIDSKGALYGAAIGGGSAGMGAVFELNPPAGPKGSWSVTTLHSFTGGTDGAFPESGVVFDASGNLYGTTDWGGDAHGNGTVYMLTPKAGAKADFDYQIIHRFTGNDGQEPVAPLTVGDGVLYGTTFSGGVKECNSQCGVVFTLEPSGGGWRYSIIHTFTGAATEGANPVAALLIGSDGALYGTASTGGTNCGGDGCGTVFSLQRNGGQWRIKGLHHFAGTDGAAPIAGLVMYRGNLYGTTSKGGSGSNGTLFELTASGANWHFATLHDFGSSPDGANPAGGLIPDGDGHLLGTTEAGGKSGNGTVFLYTP